MRTLANLTVLNSKGEMYRDKECLIQASVEINNLSKSAGCFYRLGTRNRTGISKSRLLLIIVAKERERYNLRKSAGRCYRFGTRTEQRSARAGCC